MLLRVFTDSTSGKNKSGLIIDEDRSVNMRIYFLCCQIWFMFSYHELYVVLKYTYKYVEYRKIDVKHLVTKKSDASNVGYISNVEYFLSCEFT